MRILFVVLSILFLLGGALSMLGGEGSSMPGLIACVVGLGGVGFAAYNRG